MSTILTLGERDPKSRGYHILHGVLAVLIANHLGKEHEDIGWAIGDAIYDYLVMKNKSIEDIEKRPSEFAKLVVKKLQEREILGPSVAKSTERAIKEAIPPTIKLINKLWPKDHDVKHLRAMKEAFSSDTKDPLRTLKAAGIDVTKEVEELRNAIAEITGKKPKTKKSKRRKKTVPKYPEEEISIPQVVSKAKLEVLSILNGLEFAGFSEEAKRKAIEKLSSRIVELSRERLTPENLQKLGLYAFALEIIKRSEFDRMREIKEL